MKRLAKICLAAVAVAGLLAACNEKPVEAPVGPVVERPGPIAWNGEAFTVEGQPIKVARLWTFKGDAEGFSAVTSKLAPVAGSGLSMVVADPTLRSPSGLNIVGRDYPIVLVRLTRTGEGRIWDGALYYSTVPNGDYPAHGETIGYFSKPIKGAYPKLGETTTLIYDMRTPAAGGDDWTRSLIHQIRLDLEDAAGGKFIIHQIAIAAPIDPALIPPDPKRKKAPAAAPEGVPAAPQS